MIANDSKKSASLSTQKLELRQTIRQTIEQPNITANVTHGLNEQIGQLITRLANQRSLGHFWAGYQNFGSESNLQSAFDHLKAIVDWVYPRVEGEELAFYRPGVPPRFLRGRLGVLEPEGREVDRVSDPLIQGLLVPGLAFDLHGNRLGRGAGFYDRAIARIKKSNPAVIAIGVCFDRQIQEGELPVEEFDIPMNWVVTESRCIRGSRANLNPSPPAAKKTSHASNEQDHRDE